MSVMKKLLHSWKKALATISNPAADMDTLLATVMETGKFGVDAMALLDKANTQTYGNPETYKGKYWYR